MSRSGAGFTEEASSSAAVGNGAISVFPPGVSDLQRQKLLGTISTAQNAADAALGSQARATDPGGWHEAYVNALKQQHWPVNSDSAKLSTTTSEETTLEKAILEAVARAGVAGATGAALSQLLTGVLKAHETDTQLALFTWKSARGTSVVSSINLFEWQGGTNQLVFNVLQTRTAYSNLTTDFLVLLHYTWNQIVLETWAAQLLVPPGDLENVKAGGPPAQIPEGSVIGRLPPAAP